jgi:deoxyinosine 3'endonuclease (endonuclease V)
VIVGMPEPWPETEAAALAEQDRLRGAVVPSGAARFPYIPGLLAFREIPALAEALGQGRAVPDVLVCDGYGLAHPRRFGLASHLGVLTGIPSIGVAKTAFVGQHGEPGAGRGAWADLTDGGEVIGRVPATPARLRCRAPTTRPRCRAAGQPLPVQQPAQPEPALPSQGRTHRTWQTSSPGIPGQQEPVAAAWS